MDRFRRRIYAGPGALIDDLRAMLARRDLIRSTMRDDQLDPAFRERLMLVVTGVNGCRYCSYVHAREALAAGLSAEEIAALEAGELGEGPDEELPALLYAQHWADTDAQPDPDARRRVRDRYGEERLERIEVVLRMIRMGNLMGNTFDYLLYRISFGRWGGP